jgi:hypothetical protein
MPKTTGRLAGRTAKSEATGEKGSYFKEAASAAPAVTAKSILTAHMIAEGF